jgi:nicotinamide mononucleotide adenylyltransferase
MKRGLGDWPTFVEAVENKFGAYDYRTMIHDMLGRKQEGTVEDYTKEFKAIQFHVSMFNPGFDDMFFTSQFVSGLKEEIKGAVQAQLPDSVDKASMLARIQ